MEFIAEKRAYGEIDNRDFIILGFRFVNEQWANGYLYTLTIALIIFNLVLGIEVNYGGD